MDLPKRRQRVTHEYLPCLNKRSLMTLINLMIYMRKQHVWIVFLYFLRTQSGVTMHPYSILILCSSGAYYWCVGGVKVGDICCFLGSLRADLLI